MGNGGASRATWQKTRAEKLGCRWRADAPFPDVKRGEKNVLPTCSVRQWSIPRVSHAQGIQNSLEMLLSAYALLFVLDALVSDKHYRYLPRRLPDVSFTKASWLVLRKELRPADTLYIWGWPSLLGSFALLIGMVEQRRQHCYRLFLSSRLMSRACCSIYPVVRSG